MSIALDAQCIVCHIRRHVNTALTLGDGDTATRFAKELMKLYIAAPEGVGMTALGPQVDELYRRFYDVGEDRFAAEKEQSDKQQGKHLAQNCHTADGGCEGVMDVVPSDHVHAEILHDIGAAHTQVEEHMVVVHADIDGAVRCIFVFDADVNL